MKHLVSILGHVELAEVKIPSESLQTQAVDIMPDSLGVASDPRHCDHPSSVDRTHLLGPPPDVESAIRQQPWSRHPFSDFFRNLRGS